MLVLSRDLDESIVIGDDVRVTIVDVRGPKVRVGITSPKHIPVHRRETYDAIQREKEESKKSPQRSAADKKPIDFQSHFLQSEKGSGLMLIISRQRDESIMVGDDVEVFIVGIRGNTVHLGITCPKYVPVHRSEVYDILQREKAFKKKREEEQQRSKKVRKYKEQPYLEPDIAGPLQVYIDSDAYTPEEKGILLSLISELYSIQSHDRLVIDNMGMAEPVPVEAISPDRGGL
jgi:carbon storage regulator